MTTANAEIGGRSRVLFDLREKERIFRTYGGLVEDAVVWMLSGFPKEEIEEVVSAVWLKLYARDCSRLKTFAGRNGARFPTWLVRVARNAAVDYLRRRPAVGARPRSPPHRRRLRSIAPRSVSRPIGTLRTSSAPPSSAALRNRSSCPSAECMMTFR